MDGLKVRFTLDDDVPKPHVYYRPRLHSWPRDSPEVSNLLDLGGYSMVDLRDQQTRGMMRQMERLLLRNQQLAQGEAAVEGAPALVVEAGPPPQTLNLNELAQQRRPRGEVRPIHLLNRKPKI